MVSNGIREIKRLTAAVAAEQDGVVSVFLLIVGAALIMLFLAVFNYGRYLLAAGQTELALEASLTSVLSYYQPALTKGMGLFALDTQDFSLQAKGEAYFKDNLGDAGAINGQKCLDYTISFPADSRLNLDGILAAQAIDSQRLDSVIEIGKDLLLFLGLTDWQKGLSSSSDGGEGLGEALGLADGGEADGELQIKGLSDLLNSAGSDDGKIYFLQFLLPFPPGETFVNRSMPTRSVWQEIVRLYTDRIDYWNNILTSPASAVQEEDFLPDSLEQAKITLSDLAEGLTSAISVGRDKIVFTDYLLKELDFATNKPVLNRYFPRCEVEYVICGADGSWDNVRFMAMRIFLLRASLYMLESLIKGEIVDEATLALAILEGAVKGGTDVEKLFAGERVPVYPGAAFTMSYKDHLRLFLLCQSGADQRRALQKLVQANMWHWAGGGGWADFERFTLSRYATEVRGIVETELSLWPFGSVRIRREGVMGYDRAFSILATK